MISIQKNGVFLDTAYASLASATTVNHVTNFTSNAVDVSACDILQCQLSATGTAGSAGDITFYFSATVDNTNWDTIVSLTQPYTNAILTMSGATSQFHTVPITVSGLKKIRLQRIVNASGQIATAINVNFGLMDAVL